MLLPKKGGPLGPPFFVQGNDDPLETVYEGVDVHASADTSEQRDVAGLYLVSLVLLVSNAVK